MTGETGIHGFEVLLNEVLQTRSDMTREKLQELIAEKKRSVGAGYLTDQGALFLVAGELGVQLKRTTVPDLRLKDIHVGANDVTVVGRVLATYPVMEYARKDGTTGRYRRLNLFDGTSVVRLTIWDDNNEAIESKDFVVDAPVRVMNGYVRPGLDGRPNLNLGKRGKIEIIADKSLSQTIVPLQSCVRKVNGLGEGPDILAVEGVACSEGRTSTFVRNDGSQGHMTQFEVSDENEPGKIRVVIWSGPPSDGVKQGMKLRVTNLRLKKTASGSLELHGDAGSLVQSIDQSQKQDRELVKVNQVKNQREPLNLEVIAMSRGSVHDVTLKDGSVVKKGELVVGDDTGEIAIVGWRELSDQLKGIEVGEKLLVTGTTRMTTRIGTEMLQLAQSSKVEKLSGATRS